MAIDRCPRCGEWLGKTGPHDCPMKPKAVDRGQKDALRRAAARQAGANAGDSGKADRKETPLWVWSGCSAAASALLAVGQTGAIRAAGAVLAVILGAATVALLRSSGRGR